MNEMIFFAKHPQNKNWFFSKCSLKKLGAGIKLLLDPLELLATDNNKISFNNSLRKPKKRFLSTKAIIR
jgi:hypothetical protein